MYLSIGNDMAVRDSSIIGIFDLDNTSTSRRTREFLTKSEENGEVVPCDELPKSFVLTSEYGFTRVRLTSLNAATLEKRLKSFQADYVTRMKRPSPGGKAFFCCAEVTSEKPFPTALWKETGPYPMG